MNPQEFIEERLEQTKASSKVAQNLGEIPIEEKIKKLILSKKFRKYSAKLELIEQIEEAIALNVKENKPINLTFLNGAYKLWRLEESPNPDWAELFSLMYYTNWVKPICEIYEPGVHFDFFMDDFIVSRMNNISASDIRTYINSFNALLSFIKKYQPDNLEMTLTSVGSQFESEETFNKLLDQDVEELTKNTPGGLVEINDELKATIELNVKPTKEQLEDLEWQRKVWHLHVAYSATKKSVKYHHDRPEKILVFTQPLPSGKTVSVGTTKSSVMKFWVGAGVLKQDGGSYKEIILSSKQIEEDNFEFHEVYIDSLDGENFKKIRVLK